MKVYPEPVWQRFVAPRHVGTLAVPSATGKAQSRGADNVVELDVRVQEGVVAAAVFRAHGGPTTVAAADWVCERILGEALEVATALSAQDFEDALGLAPDSRGCCLVVLDAVGAALSGSVTVGAATK